MSFIKKPMHPGEFLKLAFLDTMELTVTKLAKEIDVNPSTLSRLINEKSELSFDMAIKLESRFGRTAESWMNLQISHGLYLGRLKEGLSTSNLEPALA
jgi:addiction module HigA family antidote